MVESDRQYFARRASDERAAAADAAHEAAGRAHRELAARYEELARAIGQSEQQIANISAA